MRKESLFFVGRMPNQKTHAVLLPSDKTKADIHEEYIEACDSLNLRKISLSKFKEIRLEQTPNILIIKPATDLCHTCQSYVGSITHSGNLTEEEKTLKLTQYQDHIDKAKTQRDNYRNECDEAKTVYLSLPEEKKTRGQPQCSLEGTQHYSFDYAQQVHYPHYAQQVGPLFFKTPRKCQCFGICAEGSGSQLFYLVDEAQHSGKGANSVASMLHHNFEYKGYGETDVKLHMDNCTGQNKNNTVLGYGLWRTMTGRHNSVQFSMMEVGHTKFHPDWHFGVWKVKWRVSNAETMKEVAESVSKSSRNGHNIPQLVDDPECPVIFYDWSAFLKQYFKPIHQLKSYHHFRMDKSYPGIVFVKKYATDNETRMNLLKKNVREFQFMDPELPTVIATKGLDAARQWYLHTEIAPYCLNKEACPMPNIPKPETIKIESSEVDLKRKCGHCKKSGHTKSRNGKITCPLLLEQ